MAYFDHANSSPVDERVIDAMLPYFREMYGTAGLELGHSKDVAALTGLEEAREVIARSLNADSRAIVFTSGVTESNNMAIRGVAVANKDSGRHIITTPIETQSVLQSCKRLESAGYEITMLDVDERGLISLKQLKKAIRDDTILVSIQHANGEIGTVQPVDEIAKIATERGITSHMMRIPIDTETLPVNLISFDAHRIHGPKGIGVLYIRRKTRIKRVLEGGDEERRLRPGRENIPAAVGMAKAIEIWEPNENDHVLHLRRYLKKKLDESLTGFTLTGHPERRAPHIFSMVVEHVEGESMLVHLDMLGYAVSTGSACSSKTLQGSHVLRAIGLPPEVSHGSVRVSFARYNSEAEIDGFVEELRGTVERLREFSPLRSGGYFANEEKEEDHHHDVPEDDW
ncbi:MAG: cysteine desulfurase family protein [Candidatus Thorarchaeota archaeon]